jgi:hypothetical protein
MNTRIERNFDFQAAVYFNDSFTLNLYNLKIKMIVATDVIREQVIALDRIKCFLAESLQDCVFIESTEKKSIEKFKDAGIKICTLPEEPYDQIVGIAMLLKLNSITEGKIIIEEITIGSRLNDDVRMIFNKDEPIGPFASTGWWYNASPSINDLIFHSKKEKIVKLPKSNEWVDYNLLWEEKVDVPLKESNQIYFINELEK